MEKMKQEAMIHIAHSRYEWFRNSGQGMEHVVKHMDPNALWAVLPQIWRYMERHDQEARIALEEMARFLGRELAKQASGLAQEDSRRWIDEVWENRHNREYLPPWESEHAANRN